MEDDGQSGKKKERLFTPFCAAALRSKKKEIDYMHPRVTTSKVLANFNFRAERAFCFSFSTTIFRNYKYVQQQRTTKTHASHGKSRVAHV